MPIRVPLSAWRGLAYPVAQSSLERADVARWLELFVLTTVHHAEPSTLQAAGGHEAPTPLPSLASMWAEALAQASTTLACLCPVEPEVLATLASPYTHRRLQSRCRCRGARLHRSEMECAVRLMLKQELTLEQRQKLRRWLRRTLILESAASSVQVHVRTTGRERRKVQPPETKIASTRESASVLALQTQVSTLAPAQ